MQNLLSSSLQSKNLKIKVYRTIILPVGLLNGCETWSPTLREERRVLMRVFGPKRDEVTGNGENYALSLVICTPYPILCGKIEKNEMGGACGAYGGGERCAQGSGGET